MTSSTIAMIPSGSPSGCLLRDVEQMHVTQLARMVADDTVESYALAARARYIVAGQYWHEARPRLHQRASNRPMGFAARRLR